VIGRKPQGQALRETLCRARPKATTGPNAPRVPATPGAAPSRGAGQGGAGVRRLAARGRPAAPLPQLPPYGPLVGAAGAAPLRQVRHKHDAARLNACVWRFASRDQTFQRSSVLDMTHTLLGRRSDPPRTTPPNLAPLTPPLGAPAGKVVESCPLYPKHTHRDTHTHTQRHMHAQTNTHTHTHRPPNSARLLGR
jgi:hypothetical protein